MLVHAKCKNCGKEFEYENAGGRRRAYCSAKCKIKRDNQAYNDRMVEKTGQNYWEWKYNNDPEFRERRKKANNERIKVKREEKRIEKRDMLVAQIRGAETIEEAIDLFEAKARIRSENYR